MLVAYAALPWTGIMLLGFGAGRWYDAKYFTALQRRKAMIVTGFSVIAVFVLVRFVNMYGDPEPWEEERLGVYKLLSFLNTNKYPPSLLYACMTLGPALIALALIENVRNRFTAIMNIFGRVPFFYYLLHVYLIHLLCTIAYFAEGYAFADLFRLKMQFAFRPDENFGYSLGVVYLVWLLVVVLCYFPSRWYDKYKTTHKKWWLSYV